MRQPLLVVLHLAQHRDDRDQQARVLQDRERPRVAGAGVGVVGRQRRDRLGRGLAVVAGEAGVGDRAHRTIVCVRRAGRRLTAWTSSTPRPGRPWA